MSLIELNCKTQNYAWGKVGNDSLVYQLSLLNNKELDESLTYSELWMGVHKNGPSKIKDTDELLNEWMKKNGCKNELPFLFKILSIAKPLSIQAHPTKERAIELHLQMPDIYKDSNHKPELACPLTEFEALVGFRKLKEIRAFLNLLPEFAFVIGEDIVTEINTYFDEFKFTKDKSKEKNLLKKMFTKLINTEQEIISTKVNELIERLNENEEQYCIEEDDELKKLIPVINKVNSFFEGDVGIFCIFILNYIKITEDRIGKEAIFLPANEPHAYLNGNIVECMANSDNVVRAGLTIKLKHAEVLCDMLTYDASNLSNMIIKPVVSQLPDSVISNNDCRHSDLQYTVHYPVPVDEFLLLETNIPLDHPSNYVFPNFLNDSILLVTKGNGSISNNENNKNSHPLEKGKVFFIKSNTKIIITVNELSNENLQFFICTSSSNNNNNNKNNNNNDGNDDDDDKNLQ